MASFQIKCPNCETEIMMQEEWLGMQMECPACHNLFTVSGNNPPKPFQNPSVDGNMPNPAVGSRFCTNCGSPVALQAVVCVRCGCHPNQEKHFCASCGNPVSPAQSVCLQCGMSLNSYYGAGAAGSPPKSRTVAAMLAIFLGSWGAHMFYLDNTNSAVIRLAVSLLTCLLLSPILWIISLIEGIMYLTMDDAAFQEKYVINKQGWL